MAYVVEINELPSLAAYRAQWQTLHARTEAASFFLTLEWLEAYWQHFGSEQKLRVLLVYEGSELQGILPLCVREESFKVGRLRVLTYPLHDWHSYYGPLGPDRLKTLTAGLQHVRHTVRDWDLVDLRWTDSQLDRGATDTAMRAARMQPLSQPWDHSGVISFPENWNEWYDTRPSKWRTNWRRHQRRLAELGPVEHVRYRPQGQAAGEEDPRWDLYEECEQIALKSWQGSSKNGTTLTHDSVRSFFRECHRRAAQLGMLDLNLLRVGDRPAAFIYNFAFRGQLQGVRVGFDEVFSRQGAGNVVYLATIENSFQRGDKRFDLGPGSLEAKRPLITQVEPCLRYTYFSPKALRAQALKAKHLVRLWWGERQTAKGGPEYSASPELPAPT